MTYKTQVQGETISGIKTFVEAPIFSSASASKLMATDAGKALASVAYGSGNTVGSGAFTWTATTGNIAEYDSAKRNVHWIRIGNTVHVSGSALVDTAGSPGGRGFRISLPVASDLTTESDLSGVCGSDGATGAQAIVYGDPVNNAASIFIGLNIGSPILVTFSFAYTVN